MLLLRAIAVAFCTATILAAPSQARADEPGSGRVSGARTLEWPRWPLASLASAARADEPGSGRVSGARTLEWPRWPLASLASAAQADDPFYKGKRLTLLINFAAGGPTDIEGRMFSKHLARHIEGQPSIVIQNMEGAGGVVGAKFMGEVAPRDGTMAGYFTGTAFIYALDPERFRVDFKTYEFVATQAGTTVHFVRTDVPPGMKQATDIVKAQGLIGGGLSVDTSKDIRMRLAFDMLGIPYKYVTGYRSSPSARLALQRGEINFFAELPPSYRGVIEPSMVKTGQVIPVFYDPSYDGRDFLVPHPVKGLTILPFHELYRAIKGTMPSGQLWDIYKSIISSRRDHPAHDRDAAGRAEGGGRGVARGDSAPQRRPGLCRGGREGLRFRAAMGGRSRHQQDRADRADGAPRGARVPYGLHQECAEVTAASPLPACGERSPRFARRVRGLSISRLYRESPSAQPSPRKRGEGAHRVRGAFSGSIESSLPPRLRHHVERHRRAGTHRLEPAA